MAGLSSLVVLALVAIAALVVVSRNGGRAADEPFVVPPPTARPVVPEPGGAAAALSRLQRAVGQGDAATARAQADPSVSGMSSLLGGLVATAKAAQLRDVGFRYVDELGGVDPTGAWTADVAVTWRIARFDPEPAHADVEVTFRITDDGVRVAALGGSQLRTPVWLSGPVAVHRSADVVVLDADGADTLARYASLAEHAVRAVPQVVPGWRPRLVVEVPPSLEALNRALLQKPGSDAQIAAVTTSVDDTTTAGSPVHIVVNPAVFGPLPRLGAQVVMTHETTHVATAAFTSQAPTWLKEGIADYTALRDVRLPLSRTAGQISAQVRRDGVPAHLPTDADFSPDAPRLGTVYEAAWLVCVTLADHAGQQALLDVYRATSSGTPLAAALAGVTDWTPAQLLAAWQARLRELASDPAARAQTAGVPDGVR